MATDYAQEASRAARSAVVYGEASAATPSASAVSWGAIFAGAVGAASLSLVLLLLGTGLGFSSISPWNDRGAGAAAVGIATVLWLSFTQIAASGMGGYLAGRLRSRWAGVQGDEVYFRDTAHGFLAWSVATLLTATLLSSAIGAVIGSGVQAGATALGGAASTATVAGAAASDRADSDTGGVTGYFVDSLFRRAPSSAPSAQTAVPTSPTADGATGMALAPAAARPQVGGAASSAEVGRIFVTSLSTGSLSADDARYVAQIVAQRTDLSQADAEKRVNDTFSKAKARIEEAKTQAKEAADTARKASAYAAMWLVVSLMLGAFVASFAATYGGRRRDL